MGGATGSAIERNKGRSGVASQCCWLIPGHHFGKRVSISGLSPLLPNLPFISSLLVCGFFNRFTSKRLIWYTQALVFDQRCLLFRVEELSFAACPFACDCSELRSAVSLLSGSFTSCPSLLNAELPMFLFVFRDAPLYRSCFGSFVMGDEILTQFSSLAI